MLSKYERKITAQPSLCDGFGRLGVVGTLDAFMDIAAEHAEMLGNGCEDMTRRGLFWLTVKTRARFSAPLPMMHKATIATWPARPKRLRGDRFYTIINENGVIAEGRTEWAVMDVRAGALSRLGGVYPTDFKFAEDEVCGEGYRRMRDDFSDAVDVGAYFVKSTDIDFGGHMNNVAYVRALLGAFSLSEQKALGITEVEIHFRHSCFEGERLAILRRDVADGVELALRRPDGETGAMAFLSSAPLV